MCKMYKNKYSFDYWNDWPPNSPDLSPMKNIWCIIKQQSSNINPKMWESWNIGETTSGIYYRQIRSISIYLLNLKVCGHGLGSALLKKGCQLNSECILAIYLVLLVIKRTTTVSAVIYFTWPRVEVALDQTNSNPLIMTSFTWSRSPIIRVTK